MVPALMELDSEIRGIAYSAFQGLSSLRSSSEVEDLVQDIYAQAISELGKFRGESKLSTWIFTLAKNHLRTLASREKIRKTYSMSDEVSKEDRGRSWNGISNDGNMTKARWVNGSRTCSPSDEMDISEQVEVIRSWLRENPRKVRDGLMVVDRLLEYNFDYGRVGLELSLGTSEIWTTERVRRVIRKIRKKMSCFEK